GAAGLGAGARDGQHLVRGQVRALAAARRRSEGAVVADVAAELRQRDEDLRRVRDEEPGAGGAEPARRLQQIGGVELGERECVVSPHHACEHTQAMDAHVLVPLKRLNGAKTRLAAVLSPEERAALMRRMLADVAEAVRRAGIRRITLVCAEPVEIDGLAHFDDRGLPWNEALAAAMRD